MTQSKSRLFYYFLWILIQLKTINSTIKLVSVSSSLSLRTFNLISCLFLSKDFIANVVYNKLSVRPLNLPHARLISIEPKDKIWFHIENQTLFALPLFGDYPGPFHLHYRQSQSIDLKLQFEIAPSTSLFSPSDHLLLARFNLSSKDYRNSSSNRFLIVKTLSLALNISSDLLTIHRINGSTINVYFSCDFFHSTNLSDDIYSLMKFYQTNRIRTSLNLIEISIVRLEKIHRTKTAFVTVRSRLKNVTLSNPLMFFHRVYQPLVLVPLLIIIIGLVVCSLISFCLCCHRRSSSSSTLLLPTGRTGTPNNKHLYENYAYRKYRQQQELYKRKKFHRDQRQFISKGSLKVRNDLILFHCFSLLKEFPLFLLKNWTKNLNKHIRHW